MAFVLIAAASPVASSAVYSPSGESSSDGGRINAARDEALFNYYRHRPLLLPETELGAPVSQYWQGRLCSYCVQAFVDFDRSLPDNISERQLVQLLDNGYCAQLQGGYTVALCKSAVKLAGQTIYNEISKIKAGVVTPFDVCKQLRMCRGSEPPPPNHISSTNTYLTAASDNTSQRAF